MKTEWMAAIGNAHHKCKYNFIDDMFNCTDCVTAVVNYGRKYKTTGRSKK
ncbi:hypothetical protein SAMN05421739_104484 [Pontibacter chinhatensis]|uniref:Uncharacterized protein n=1 Tax=Pontibacter chinhatensis TaxID=1436961 RepID=A0A1I2W2D9_9BACT|nr:hypothetical protein SAMN05421739_104484 [Pontibacter chinhatensis]